MLPRKQAPEQPPGQLLRCRCPNQGCPPQSNSASPLCRLPNHAHKHSGGCLGWRPSCYSVLLGQVPLAKLTVTPRLHPPLASRERRPPGDGHGVFEPPGRHRNWSPPPQDLPERAKGCCSTGDPGSSSDLRGSWRKDSLAAPGHCPFWGEWRWREACYWSWELQLLSMNGVRNMFLFGQRLLRGSVDGVMLKQLAKERRQTSVHFITRWPLNVRWVSHLDFSFHAACHAGPAQTGPTSEREHRDGPRRGPSGRAARAAGQPVCATYPDARVTQAAPRKRTRWGSQPMGNSRGRPPAR